MVGERVVVEGVMNAVTLHDFLGGRVGPQVVGSLHVRELQGTRTHCGCEVEAWCCFLCFCGAAHMRF